MGGPNVIQGGGPGGRGPGDTGSIMGGEHALVPGEVQQPEVINGWTLRPELPLETLEKTHKSNQAAESMWNAEEARLQFQDANYKFNEQQGFAAMLAGNTESPMWGNIPRAMAACQSTDGADAAGCTQLILATHLRISVPQMQAYWKKFREGSEEMTEEERAEHKAYILSLEDRWNADPDSLSPQEHQLMLRRDSLPPLTDPLRMLALSGQGSIYGRRNAWRQDVQKYAMENGMDVNVTSAWADASFKYQEGKISQEQYQAVTAKLLPPEWAGRLETNATRRLTHDFLALQLQVDDFNNTKQTALRTAIGQDKMPWAVGYSEQDRLAFKDMVWSYEDLANPSPSQLARFTSPDILERMLHDNQQWRIDDATLTQIKRSTDMYGAEMAGKLAIASGGMWKEGSAVQDAMQFCTQPDRGGKLNPDHPACEMYADLVESGMEALWDLSRAQGFIEPDEPGIPMGADSYAKFRAGWGQRNAVTDRDWVDSPWGTAFGQMWFGFASWWVDGGEAIIRKIAPGGTPDIEAQTRFQPGGIVGGPPDYQLDSRAIGRGEWRPWHESDPNTGWRDPRVEQDQVRKDMPGIVAWQAPDIQRAVSGQREGSGIGGMSTRRAPGLTFDQLSQFFNLTHDAQVSGARAGSINMYTKVRQPQAVWEQKPLEAEIASWKTGARYMFNINPSLLARNLEYMTGEKWSSPIKWTKDGRAIGGKPDIEKLERWMFRGITPEFLDKYRLRPPSHVRKTQLALDEQLTVREQVENMSRDLAKGQRTPASQMQGSTYWNPDSGKFEATREAPSADPVQDKREYDMMVNTVTTTIEELATKITDGSFPAAFKDTLREINRTAQEMIKTGDRNLYHQVMKLFEALQVAAQDSQANQPPAFPAGGF